MGYFTTLEQANAYWSILIANGDREKTAFNSPIGLFEFKFLPFGMCNAPATFQRLMDVLLAGLQWNICMVYLDDTMIFAKSCEEMVVRIRIVLKKLQGGRLKLRLDKCQFCFPEV